MAGETNTGELELGLAGIQTVSFDILCATWAYCRRHGLHLYLCGGTLLGAVRHGGFIPWDDDIDVFLSRPEYERLKRLVQKEPIREDLVLACRENGRLQRPFIRIYNTETTVRRHNMQDRSLPHIWLDILPVDGMPSQVEEVRRLQRRWRLLSVLNSTALWRFTLREKPGLMAVRLLLWPIACLFGADFWAGRIERLATRLRFEDCDTVGCIAFGKYGLGEMMPREAYERPVRIDFEGRSFETMSCRERYLSGIYGSYRELPPEEKRRPPHPKYAGIRPEAFEAILSRCADVYTARCGNDPGRVPAEHE